MNDEAARDSRRAAATLQAICDALTGLQQFNVRTRNPEARRALGTAVDKKLCEMAHIVNALRANVVTPQAGPLNFHLQPICADITSRLKAKGAFIAVFHDKQEGPNGGRVEFVAALNSEMNNSSLPDLAQQLADQLKEMYA